MSFKDNLGRRLIKPMLFLLAAITCFYAGSVFAQSSEGLGDIAARVTDSFSKFGQLMIAVSYLAGITFSIASIFKFKQHKDNPTQIPLGTPIALLVIGIVLIFLPSFIAPAGKTFFGDQATPGGFSGKEAASKLPGGNK